MATWQRCHSACCISAVIPGTASSLPNTYPGTGEPLACLCTVILALLGVSMA